MAERAPEKREVTGSTPVPTTMSNGQHAAGPLLPTFFIIGAGKCGTTSLYTYLDRHPEIAMSIVKEPRLMWVDPREARIAAYAEQWRWAAPMRGEASTDYAAAPRHPDTPDRIADLVPDARLLYLVRDPIDRAVAAYAQRAIKGREERPIEEAIFDRFHDYLWQGHYATQYENYLRCFDPSQILVIDQANLLAQRRETLREVFSFLGVEPGFWDPSFDEEFNTRAVNRRPNPLGRRLSRSPVARRAQRILPARLRTPIEHRLRRALADEVRPSVSPELRALLEEEFRDQVTRLRTLTGQAFSTWSI